MHTCAIYILATGKNGTLYVGSTTDLRSRIRNHRSGHGCFFTTKHAVRVLVFYELHPDKQSAMTRERQIKKWKRAWKLALIEKQNPNWRDLYVELDPRF